MKTPNRTRLTPYLSFLFWVALFTLAHSLSPLYSFNQNQYMLHGLAQAGFGLLAEDWLACTRDSVPVFSALVAGTWRMLPWPPVFYLLFAVLAAVYLAGVLSIADQLFALSKSRERRWLFLAATVLFHSALFRHFTKYLGGPEWDFLLDSGVAGQRLLDSAIQPSTFGVFLVLSIALFLRGKAGLAIFCLLIAANFHPTYLLSAGILTALYMALTLHETRQLPKALALGLVALIGVAPILWSSLSTFGGSSPELVARAREIMVVFRFPHHAIVEHWLNFTVIVKLAVVVGALAILRITDRAHRPRQSMSPGEKLFHVILWSLLVTVALTLLQMKTNSYALALIFPWRASQWLVPLSTSIVTAWVVTLIVERVRSSRDLRWMKVASLFVALALAAAGTARTWILVENRQHSDESPVTAYVREEKRHGDVYLIPTDMMNFRLESGAPVYIDFKSMPYRGDELGEWYRRLKLAEGFFAHGDCKDLSRIAGEGITKLVLPADHHAARCDTIEPEYSDGLFGVYAFSRP